VAASAQLLLTALAQPALMLEEPDFLDGLSGPGSAAVEAPLTSEPPLAAATPLTSEPPLAAELPLTSEPTPADQGQGAVTP